MYGAIKHDCKVHLTLYSFQNNPWCTQNINCKYRYSNSSTEQLPTTQSQEKRQVATQKSFRRKVEFKMHQATLCNSWKQQLYQLHTSISAYRASYKNWDKMLRPSNTAAQNRQMLPVCQPGRNWTLPDNHTSIWSFLTGSPCPTCRSWNHHHN